LLHPCASLNRTYEKGSRENWGEVGGVEKAVKALLQGILVGGEGEEERLTRKKTKKRKRAWDVSGGFFSRQKTEHERGLLNKKGKRERVLGRGPRGWAAWNLWPFFTYQKKKRSSGNNQKKGGLLGKERRNPGGGS